MKATDKKTIISGQLFIISALLLLTASAAFGQKGMYEPKKGSAERKALIDTVTAYDVTRNDDLAGEIFDVTAIKFQGNWAFLSVERSNLPEAGQGTHLALLQKIGTKWKLAWSDFNDNNEVGAEAVTRLKRKNKELSKALADFAMKYFAG